MASSTGYDYGIRNALVGKGVNNSDIGYNPKTGYVTVKGADAIKAPKQYNGTSYTSQQSFNADWDNYSKPKTTNTSASTGTTGGYPTSQPSYNGSGYTPNSGYNPYQQTTSQNPYTSQADNIIKQLLDYGKNQSAFDPYSTSGYKAAEAQAQRAAQQSTRSAQEAYGSAGFGRSTGLGERVAGITNDSTEYLMTQVVPQLEAQESARRQQEYNNILNALTPLMNQQGRADSLVQQDFNNNLATADLTGNYLPQGAQQIINNLMNLKGQAEQRGITAQERTGLSSQADTLRSQLQAMGVDVSNLGANTSLANSRTASQLGTRTLAGQAQDLNNKQANWGAYLDATGLTGNLGKGPTNNWSSLITNGTSGSPTYQAQQQEWQNNYQVGRDKVADKQWQDEFNQRAEQYGIQNALSWAQQTLDENKFNYGVSQDQLGTQEAPQTAQDLRTYYDSMAKYDDKGALTNGPSVEESILSQPNLSDYDAYQLYLRYGLNWNGPIPTPGK